jgi:hypothetical protein
MVNIPVSLKYLDFSWYADIATVGGKGNLAYTQAIFSKTSAYAAGKLIGKMIWNSDGTTAPYNTAPAGLPGIVAKMKTEGKAAWMVNSGDPITYTVGTAGTTGQNAAAPSGGNDGMIYDIWAVTTGDAGINFSWGKNGYLESGPVIPATLSDSTGKQLDVWKQVQGAWHGVYIGTANCFANLNANGGVPTEALRKLITTMTIAGQRPTALFMSYAAWDSYCNSVIVNVANNNGVQGGIAPSFDGIPVIRTINITDQAYDA